MTMSKKQKETAKTVGLWVFYIAVAVFLFFPFYYMVSRSIMVPERTAERPIIVVPGFKDLSLELWRMVLSGKGPDGKILDDNYFAYLLNSLKIVGFNIVAVPAAASFVAFGFAKCDFVGKKTVFAIMLATILLPGTIVQIPLYVQYKNLNMLNTYLPLMLPNLFGGGAMNVFLINQFMRGIPHELDEAAEIDGASAFRRYWQIVLPNCTSVLIFIIINTFVGNWGDFYGPMIYMTADSKEKYTLAYAVFKNFSNTGNAYVSPTVEGMRSAVGTLMSIPPLILFFCFQRNMVEGIVMTGIKG
jgi:multiple sugar transport system permease protein